MEFSARLVLSSNSGYSKKRVSFLHSASAYWQALLNALEGKAADCAASILQRISSFYQSRSKRSNNHATYAAACPSGEAFRYHRLFLVLVRSIPPNNSESSS
jgi:hypothetical protein